MFNVCTKPNSPTILVDTHDPIPEGYVIEATTVNPNYLIDTASPRVIPASEFRDRFTQTELAGVLSAAYSGDVNCQLLLLKVQTNTDGIQLDSTDTVQGIGYLESINVLTAERAAQILG